MLYGNHEAVDNQQARFGEARDGDYWHEQIITLRVRNTSDVRAWYLNDVLDEIDVELVGWVGIDYDAIKPNVDDLGTVDPDYPRTEEDAKICVHGNRYWWGHECGLCMDEEDEEYA